MSIQSFEEFPQLDEKRFCQIRSDLADEFPRFLALFIEHSHTLLANIHESLAKQDLEQLKIALHSFKGMSGTMGAVRLYHLCQHAESIAVTGKFNTHLITEIQNTLPELNKAIQLTLQNER